ncbi:MAG: hypothetical protein ACI841_003224 [Planctomycetota bacterium]|jgi:hypothetical protein
MPNIDSADHERSDEGKSQEACELPNELCGFHGRARASNIVLHGYSKVKLGRRRRYRCKASGKTFVAITGTQYTRPQRPMRSFDCVAMMKGRGREQVGDCALRRDPTGHRCTLARTRSFNANESRGIELVELPFDELATFPQSRRQQTWALAGIEVWSRFRLSSLVVPRTFRNTRRFVRSVANSSRKPDFPLITTDGFKFYTPTIHKVLGRLCVGPSHQ